MPQNTSMIKYGSMKAPGAENEQKRHLIMLGLKIVQVVFANKAFSYILLAKHEA